MAISDDPILSRYRAAIQARYGNRIERAMLFGSRARGTAKTDSDYDIALFLNDLTDRWQVGDVIADIELQLLDEAGASVETLIFPAGGWRDPGSPLMYEIRRDGLDL